MNQPNYSNFAVTASYVTPMYGLTGSYVCSASYVSIMPFGSGGYYANQGGTAYPGISNEHGAVRYSYWNDNQEDEILEKVEKEGLLILDQSDEGDKPAWYDVIDPKVMYENLKKFVVPPKIEEEITDLKEEKANKMTGQLVGNVSPLKKSTWKEQLNRLLTKWTSISLRLR